MYFTIIYTFSQPMDTNHYHNYKVIIDNILSDVTGITVPAIVPGSIYTDLYNARILSDPCYYRNNSLNYRWVAYENWTFQRTVERK